MVEIKQPLQRVDRRVSLQASSRTKDQQLSNEIIRLIVNFQYTLFKNKYATLKKVYSLERSDESDRKILNDWIYIASSYCYILYDNDLECCDELAVEIFSAYYFISRLVFMKIRSSSVDYNKVNLDDRKNMNILLNKYDDLLETNRREYFEIVSREIDSFLTEILGTETANMNALSPTKCLDPSVVKEKRRSKGSPEDFYPQIEEEEEDDDFASSISSHNISIDSPDNRTNFSKQQSSNTTIMRSIDAESLLSLDPNTVIILNIQTRKIHSSTRYILNIDPKSAIDPQYFNTSILPYLDNNYSIVFFTRSDSITGIERFIYNQLTSNGFKHCFWLNGGYHSFKTEFAKLKAAKDEQKNKINQSPPPPPIPVAKPLISTLSFNDTFYNPIINENIATFNNTQSVSNNGNYLYPTANNNNNNYGNSSQRFSHSYSSLNDSNSVSMNDLSKHQSSFESNDLSLRKLAISNKSLQNLQSGEKMYNNLSNNKSQTMINPPSSLPPMPPIPSTHPITTISSMPNIPAPQVYKLSRLDYKPTLSLRNLGSTCYINSMIQCLFSLTKFRHFFINDERLKTYIMHLNSRNLKLTSGFHNLFATFYDKSPHNTPPPTIDISKFLSIIARLNPSYNIPNEQQDTSQFFYYIIDELHKELKFNYSMATQLGLISISKDKGEKFYDWQTKLLMNEGYSFIQNIFDIKEAVVMKCNRCGYVSTRYDTSIMIHLSLKSTNCTLDEILVQNMTPEEMSTRLGNAWDCDGCTKVDKDLEDLQEKLEREHDISVANNMKDKDHDKDKEKNKKGKEKEKDKQKDTFLTKRLFGRHSNKSAKTSNKDSKDFNNEINESTPDLGDFAFTALTENERTEYNRLADIYTKERIAFRSVEFIELPDVLVLCLSLFNPNQQDAKVIMKNLKFPETLNMKYNQGSRKYKLNSWIDHLGSSIDSGHYTATVPFQQNSYIICDDERLTTPQNIFNNVVSDNEVYLLFYEAIA